MARLEPRELHSLPLAGYPAERWEPGISVPSQRLGTRQIQ